MRTFTKKSLEQIINIYDCKFNNDNKELIMSLFMQLFSYEFDDRKDQSIKFKNIQSITDATWKPLGKKTNELVGIPIFNDNDEKNKFYSYDLNSKTEYILNEVRGSIVHGAFIINDDGTITITDKMFQMTFEFDCIIDICSIIMNELNIIEEKEKHLYDFLQFIRDLSKASDEYNKSKIEFQFSDLKYPIILFNLLPMNEDDFHNDIEYSDFIIKLFSDKEYYKNGRLKDDTSLSVKELYKLRNCIAHGQYYSNGEDLILFDHKDIFIFNCIKLDELFVKTVNNYKR